MTTPTLDKTEAIAKRLEIFLRALNAKEAERRRVVNERHFDKYGRDLYPEGGQYVEFVLDAPGHKYQRVVEVMTEGGGRSVHCFIDRTTGDVLKAAGWKAPAPGVRFSLLDDESFARLLDVCAHASGYLYAGARV